MLMFPGQPRVLMNWPGNKAISSLELDKQWQSTAHVSVLGSHTKATRKPVPTALPHKGVLQTSNLPDMLKAHLFIAGAPTATSRVTGMAANG